MAPPHVQLRHQVAVSQVAFVARSVTTVPSKLRLTQEVQLFQESASRCDFQPRKSTNTRMKTPMFVIISAMEVRDPLSDQETVICHTTHPRPGSLRVPCRPLINRRRTDTATPRPHPAQRATVPPTTVPRTQARRQCRIRTRRVNTSTWATRQVKVAGAPEVGVAKREDLEI